ncbi:MAG: hypothetical protein JSV36_12165 [Anaerolineae bacterium]|nr:MAG: hypothetical protein JSV36_12165 [Anaerolineae bacterium]
MKGKIRSFPFILVSVVPLLVVVMVSSIVALASDGDLVVTAPSARSNPAVDDSFYTGFSLAGSRAFTTTTSRYEQEGVAATAIQSDTISPDSSQSMPYERRLVTYWDPLETAPTSVVKGITPDYWGTGSPIPTGPRYRAAGVSCDGRTFYVFGGKRDTGTLLNEAWQYDVASDSWAALASMPVALMNFEAACIGNRVYLVGGYDSDNGAHTNDFQIYDVVSESWTATTWPNARTPMTAVWDGKLYAFGGNPGPSDETWMYDPADGTWTGPLAAMPTANTYGAAVTVDDYIYQVGGGLNNIVQRYDPFGNVWDNSGPQLQDSRMSALTIWYGDYIYVVSGAQIVGSVWTAWNSTEVYDPAQWPGGAWVYDDETVPTPAVAMAGDCAVGVIWGAGGTDSGVRYDSNQYLDDDACCHVDDTPPSGSFQINGGNTYVNSTSVTLNVSVVDNESCVKDMRFRNDAPLSALVLQDDYPWDKDAVQQLLAANNIPYDQLDSSAMSTVNLEPYAMVIIPSDQPQGFYDTYDANRARFEAYVSGGGLLEFHAAAWGWNGGDLAGIPLPGGVDVVESYHDFNYIEEPTHPLVAGVANPVSGNWASHGYFTDVPAGTLIICTEGIVPGGNPTLIEYPYGDGMVIATGQTLEIGWTWRWSGRRILVNSIPYLAGHMPWATAVPWELSSSDGVKTVYGGFGNNAGLWSAAYNDTITLDTVAPTASVSCPSETADRSFTVSWSGSDSLSGVASYAVQYRVGVGGTWMTWLPATTQTSATFGPNSPVTVEGDQTYYFRARARDRAGNDGQFVYCSTYVSGESSIYLPAVLRNVSSCAPPCSASNNYCEDHDSWGAAYGPLCFSTQYQAYPDDSTDYYYFELGTTQHVTIRVQNYQATGDLILYRHREGDEPEFVAQWGAGGSTMTIARSLGAGRYYVRVYTTGGHSTTHLYTLTVSY